MSTSNRTSLQELVEQTQALCWGAWTELGVSGWGRTHQDWAIDPEPLLVLTVRFVHDARLRDEVTDWCSHYWRHLSQTRLRHILSRQSEETLDEWGRFAATVNSVSSAALPRATTPWTHYRATGRSSIRSLREPSMVLLRMRAVFGIGARTEILRHFLFHPGQPATASMLASVTNYAKRNVADSCDLLVQAGLLSSKRVANRYYFTLANHSSMQGFVGPVPGVAPDWNALCRVVSRILMVAALPEESPHEVLVVETNAAIRDIEDDLAALGTDSPRRVPSAAVVDEWTEWSDQLMRALASGTLPEAV
jgi:hypothetical protein